MRPIGSINTFWWFAGLTILATLALVGFVGALFLRELTPDQKTLLIGIVKAYFAYIFITLFFLVAALFIALDAVFHTYIIPVNKITEQTAIIATVNPALRIKSEGSRDIQRLAEIINLGAENFEKMRRDTNDRIENAKAELEAEKNILAGFISELPQGVVVCNREGRILLYNGQARGMLSGSQGQMATPPPEASPAVQRYLGLGRSIYDLLDRSLLQHAQEELEQKLAEPNTPAVSHFLVVGYGGDFLNAEMAPILDDEERLNGFILILQNITRRLVSKQQVAYQIQKMTNQMRASLAGIRSAIESIIDFPDLDRPQLDRFQSIIHQEALAIGDHLDRYIPKITPRSISRWPLIPVKGDYLVAAVLQRAAEHLGIKTVIERCDDSTWVKIESYSMVFAILFVLKRLRELTPSEAYHIVLAGEEAFVVFDLIWAGDPLKLETLRKWRKETLSLETENLELSLDEVLQNHGAELWTYRNRQAPARNHLRFYLPRYNPDNRANGPQPVRQALVGRPEFYDFDLFNQPGQDPEIDKRLLQELTYTVFDTETTGLNPAEGDRIISIGAVRIVNGRLLKEELFEQLVNPQRSIPPESIAIHGIHPEMLADQPTIESVLPRFQQFAAETILIAHNAAFDMRMLQISEAATGIRFINPVLDTLLLSALVHPAHNTHTINQIAQRLGVEVTDRHSALGDAITTAQIFLKMIPLLAAVNITTLGEARLAARKTYYARLKY